MPPEHPPTNGPDPHDDRLHRMFSAFRDIVRPTPEGRRAAIVSALRATRRPRPAAPSPLTVLGAGLVQLLNLLAAVLPSQAHRSPDPRPGPPAPRPQDDHEQP